jgi:ribosome maturation factor RimP
MIYQTQLETKIFDIVNDSLVALGYDIVRIKLSHSGERTLQFMIDRVDGKGLTLEDCEKASRHVSVLLDVENPIDSEYNLEMSSPGLNRPLTRHKDFTNNVGNIIKLTTKAPIDGQKKFTGRLIGFETNIIKLELPAPQGIVEINFDHIFEAHLDYFASNIKKRR